MEITRMGKHMEGEILPQSNWCDEYLVETSGRTSEKERNNDLLLGMQFRIEL